MTYQLDTRIVLRKHFRTIKTVFVFAAASGLLAGCSLTGAGNQPAANTKEQAKVVQQEGGGGSAGDVNGSQPNSNAKPAATATPPNPVTTPLMVEPEKPPVRETPTTTPTPKAEKQVPKTVSGGMLNGKATSLPTPSYPAAAKAVRASGSVNVQVLVDESGRVISASAVSGHPLLRSAAESAARGARFSPTVLSGQAVKVSGVIVYNFNL